MGREEDPMQLSPKATYKGLTADCGAKTLKLMEEEAEECKSDIRYLVILSTKKE